MSLNIGSIGEEEVLVKVFKHDIKLQQNYEHEVAQVWLRCGNMTVR